MKKLILVMLFLCMVITQPAYSARIESKTGAAAGGGSESTTVSDTTTIDLTLTGSDITADAKTAAVSNGAATLTTGDQVYDFCETTQAYLTAEVDGSTTNEINTITCPDANVTAGLGITFAQSGPIAITEAADTITFTVTEVDPTVDTADEIEAILTNDAINFGTGVVTATGFAGPLTGDVTGNCSGTSATFTGNLSGEVTSVAMTTTIADSIAVTSWNLTTPTLTTSLTTDAKTISEAEIGILDGGIEGTEILSTGESGASKYLREDGDGTCSWQTVAGGGDALTTDPLSQFASTTSAELAGVISNETGTGTLVYNSNPSMSDIVCADTLLMYEDHDTPANAFILSMRKARDGDPTDNVSDNDVLGYLRWEGYGGETGYYPGALIQGVVDGDTGAEDMPSRLEFRTSPDGDDTPVLAMTISSAQVVTFANDLADSEISDTLTSSTCTGNAATVTNATLTTALTVDTGTVGLTGNVANNSVLTIGAGAVSVSGANTGDNTVATSGDAAVDFFGAGVTAVTDATTCTDIEGTGLAITAGTLNWTAASTDLSDTAALLYETELDAFSELQTQISDKTLVNTADGAVWSGTHDFGGATLEIPQTAGDLTLSATSNIAIDTAQNQVGFYSGAEKVLPLNHIMQAQITTGQFDADPDFKLIELYTNIFPDGIVIVNWEVKCNEADPATELNANIYYCDDNDTGAFPGANPVLVDVIDTTTGNASEATMSNSDLGSGAIPAGKMLYVIIDADPVSDTTIFYLDLEFYIPES